MPDYPEPCDIDLLDEYPAEPAPLPEGGDKTIDLADFEEE
jgi:hypothetical protein